MPKQPIIHLPHHQQEHSASCLPACLVMVLSHWGSNLAEADVRRVLGTKPYSGTHAISLLRLSELGFEAWPLDGNVTELQRRVGEGVPVIVFLWTGSLRYWSDSNGVDYMHTVVVVGWTEMAVWVHDPVLPSGPTEIEWDEFIEAWGFSRQMMAVVQPR
ncbi:MAG: hypothetical protein COW33_05925 [Anaerolineae bacterium CG17_big_fil_post_rev_8_21_14_2_50_57_27]|nr:MAG: hypothetical protein COS63_00765 [Anaerolineae bacterium CG06_land_8_20_14_3_00_57_67]PIW18170.1 MAG: hypothetical protein COW33_05925 [Anaerolineae bacterium CG17_big_fil_post_rev_8_21_14_2_50_57_27]